MKNPQHDWHNPNVSNYQNTIRQKISGYDLIYDMMTDILQSYPTDNMLIVGAGGGQELFSLGQAFPFSHFTAIDTSKIMLQAARKHIEKLESPLHIDWYEEDLLALVFDHQFEVASCHLVSHFIEEHEQKKLYYKNCRIAYRIAEFYSYHPLMQTCQLYHSNTNSSIGEALCCKMIYLRNTGYALSNPLAPLPIQLHLNC